MNPPPTTPSDTDLLRLARSGDQAACGQLYERYAPAIYRYIYHRLGEVELAEDLCSDVFLRMVEQLDRYEDRGLPLSAWLYRLAHDRTVDVVRRGLQRPQVPLDDWSVLCDGPEETLAPAFDHAEVAALLPQLTPEQCRVIQLRFGSELPLPEIAARLHRSENAVRALQHRALQALARMLEVAQ